MRVFDLRYEGARQAAGHQAVVGLPVLGRGTFSVVYDSGRTVRKLTIDTAAADFLTRHKNCLSALPKVVEDFGVVGHYKKAPIRLIEMEKLAPLDRHRREGHYARTLCKMVHEAMPEDWVRHGRANIDYRKMLTNVVDTLRRDGRYSPAIVAAVDYMGDVLGGSHFGLDFHPKNIMQRARGELVLIDPVADFALYDLM